MSSTPVRSPGGGSSKRRESFSPIILPESPVTSMKQKGNLTGNARIIRDNCASICNLSKKWDVSNQVGADIVMKIINLKLEAREQSTGSSEEVQYPVGLEELIIELENTCANMATIVDEMEKSKGHLLGVEKLEKFQNKGDTPIFVSWPTAKFGQFADYVASVYRKELKVKVKVKEKIAHQSTRENLMFYFSCWFYQVYIDKDIKEELYNMAMEVGFR
nr:PREDICTED: cyclin-dependent kinase 2-interacting protein-like [Bemisia tabaci]